MGLNEMVIDRGSKIPLYKQIYNDINDRINKGEYALGSMLPSEKQLCEMYGVQRATVRKALALMVEEGKITKLQGLGSSVTYPNETNGQNDKKNLLFLIQRGMDNEDRIIEPFNAKLMATFDHECTKRGFSLLYKSFSLDDTADGLIKTCNPCGVFYTNSLPTEIYTGLLHRGIPVILVNFSHPFYPSVCLDNLGAGKMVVDYLCELGHREIAFVGGRTETQVRLGRLNGYKEALEKHGIPLNPDWIIDCGWSIDEGRRAFRELCKKGKLPTAVFAANDSIGIGIIMEATSMGISVPDDISVVGFDNINQSSYIKPSLTTVAVDYDLMARAACMLMIDMIDQNNLDLKVNVYVPVSLIERESTRHI
mgnify:FL=1